MPAGSWATSRACLRNDRVSDLEIDVEDVAELVLRFAGGVLGSIHLDMVQATATRTCRIIGTEGTIEWDGVNRSARLFAADRKPWTDLYGRPRTSIETRCTLTKCGIFWTVSAAAQRAREWRRRIAGAGDRIGGEESAAGGRSVELPR